MTDSGIPMNHGTLLVHKPVGMSSAQLVARVKKLFKARKAGHSGTLDPFAEGLMVLGLNHGTRLSRFFLAGDKRYTAEITFGSETDTLDSTGTTVRTCSEDFFRNNPDFFLPETLERLIRPFEGPIFQTPPVYSALKHNGVPLYKLARKGTPVQKEARLVTIHSLTLLAIRPPSITVDVCCSSGTYIRSLAADIGEKAGCPAHLSALLRTESCGFSLSDAWTLERLAAAESQDDALIPLTEALPHLPCFTVGDAMRSAIMNGVSLDRDNGFLAAVNQAPLVKILDEQGRLIALVEFDKTKGSYNYCCVFHD